MEYREIIGLLPAGGQATRLSPLPLSKELFPIGFYTSESSDRPKPKVVSHYLLEKMRRSGITKAFFILRPGKWDIPAYFGDGSMPMLNLALGYLTVHVSHGVPYTLNQAYPFVQQSLVALGFPDILFEPEDAYQRLITRQQTSQADVVLGLFPTQQYWKAGMVAFDPTGRVTHIIEKPPQSDLQYMWAIALWTPRFTQFLHEFVNTVVPDRELPMGDVIQAGIAAGLQVEAETFPEGQFLDVGTPEDLMQAIHRFTPIADSSVL
jgi:glucose-1-phosphate thymidylyltransferase